MVDTASNGSASSSRLQLPSTPSSIEPGKGRRKTSNASIISSNGSSPGTVAPGGGILANAHEAPPRKPEQGTVKAALISAFIPPQPGKQMKKTKKPLGKSFQRTTPLPAGTTLEGGEVLQYDPRGDKATAGDGILPPTVPLTEEPLGLDDQPPLGHRGSVSEGSESPGWAASSDAGSVASTADTSEGSVAGGYRGRGSSVSSSHLSAGPRSASSSNGRAPSVDRRDSSASSSCNVASIRFAPLPSSGRLKRANSITIGVAARSQLLHSQGSSRANQAWQQFQAAQKAGDDANGAAAAYQHMQAQQAKQQNSHSAARHAGPQPSYYVHPRQGEVIDVGEEIRKGAMKAWNLMRGNSSSKESSASAAPAAENGTPVANGAAPLPTVQPVVHPGPAALAAAAAAGGGEATPKRAQSPTRGVDETGASAVAASGAPGTANAPLASGGKPDLYKLAEDEEHHAATASGTQTPRLGRRLSTGGFLGSASIRGMQQQRRRELRGEDDDDDDGDEDEHPFEVSPEEQKRRDHERADRFAEALGKVHREQERTDAKARAAGGAVELRDLDVEERGEDDDDEGEGEEEKDEETLEAERLAEQAMQAHSHKANHAAGKEKVGHRRG